ncbi:MAG: aminoacetone oxidase family FAD-binding enzyme, partial [Microscillaceae bacterium]|nr:aminoacetone oxidase family FAD-binding enzyme [Microscillaceae bacterium]
SGIKADQKWAELSKNDLHSLTQQLHHCEIIVTGKGAFKEEFVTCGGIQADDIHWETMESRKVPGLYFAGEVLDVDGITGGFNFQSAWATGFVAGEAAGHA